MSLCAYVAEIVARDTMEGRWPKALFDLREQGGADVVDHPWRGSQTLLRSQF